MRRVLIGLAATLAIAGCGQSGPRRRPQTGRVPLVAGARIVARARSCDRGANAYCSLQMVVVGPGYGSSEALFAAQQARLRALGWTSTVGDTGKQRSSDSPGNRLRLIYAIAFDDLESWDNGSLGRRPQIARALSRTLFARQPALSMMLLAGSA